MSKKSQLSKNTYIFAVFVWYLSAILAGANAAEGKYVAVFFLVVIGIYYSLLKSYYEDAENPNG